MSCQRCGAAIGGASQCPRCGAVVAADESLELAVDLGPPLPPADAPSPAPVAGTVAPPMRKPDLRSFQERQADSNRDFWRVARLPIVALLGWFTLSHLVLGSTWIFIDHVNLALHEAGHLIFRPFGTTAHFLGGTLGQLLWPAIFAIYFRFWRKDNFAAVACVWWFGENFIGIARYMSDAVVRELPLVGGGIHDWHWLFDHWDMLDQTQSVASTTRWIGVLIMLPALGYLGYRAIKPSADDVAGGMDAPD